MTTLQNLPTDGPSTTERRFTAEQHLRRNLGITDSARERVRTRLIDVAIEDSPVKRDRPRDRDKDQLVCSVKGEVTLVVVENSRSFIFARRIK